MDDDKVSNAEEAKEYGLKGGDHHLINGTWYEDEEHAVGEVFREVGDDSLAGAGQGPVVLPPIHDPHLGHQLRGSPVDVCPGMKTRCGKSLNFW